MKKWISKFYFYLLLLNIPVAANEWNIFGIFLGQLLFWFIISLSLLVLLYSEFRIITLILFIISLILKILSSLYANPLISLVGDVFLSGIFILTGYILYGASPKILFQQIFLFLLLCLPIMIFQKIGISVFFYGWSTELFHNNDSYTFDAIKDLGNFFKDIPLNKTLFVDSDNLSYLMYQARPTGLLNSNNVLSAFISISLPFLFILQIQRNKYLYYFVIISTLILAMSTLSFLIFILLFLKFISSNNKNFKNRAILLFYYFIMLLSLHYVFFPGLTLSSIGNNNLISIGYRFADIAQSIGITNFIDIFGKFTDTSTLDNIDFNENSYSLISIILKNDYILFILIFIFFILFKFYKKVIIYKRNGNEIIFYSTLFLILLLIQFSGFFLKAPSFQMILGVAVTPLFYKSRKI